MSRVRRDEQGVALVLALSFMVLIGVVTTALLSSLMGAVGSAAVLDDVRNRQYAAEARSSGAIATVRAHRQRPQVSARDLRLPRTRVAERRHDPRRLHEHPHARPRTGFLQRNVVFTSCVGTATCTTANTIVRAQVNYESARRTRRSPRRTSSPGR